MWHIQRCHRSFGWKPSAVSKSTLAGVHLSRLSTNLRISRGGRVSEKIALAPEVAVLVWLVRRDGTWVHSTSLVSLPLPDACAVREDNRAVSSSGDIAQV